MTVYKEHFSLFLREMLKIRHKHIIVKNAVHCSCFVVVNSELKAPGLVIIRCDGVYLYFLINFKRLIHQTDVGIQILGLTVDPVYRS